MRASLRLRRVPVAGVVLGRLVVARAFTDAERGVVECAVAPLLAASLAAEHTDVWLDAAPDQQPGLAGLGGLLPAVPGAAADGPVRGPVRGPDPAQGEGVMWAVSYLDRAGTVGGFAVVAHRDDTAGVAVAERVVERWMGLLRSRRLLVADTARLCWGGERAVGLISEAVKDAAPGGGPVVVLGRPVAGPQALERLERSGVVFADRVEDVPPGARVVIPAHGAGPAEHAEAAARGLRVVDGTCPLVAPVHADAAAYAARGDLVVVIGRAGHAALPPLTAQAAGTGQARGAGEAVLVEDAGQVAGLPGGRRVSFVVDPAMPVEQATPVLAALRQRFPDLRGHHFDVLCNAASDRAASIASVAVAGELMLILAAGQDDADTRSLLRAAAGAGGPVRVVTRLADLDADLLAGATVIGLAEALTAPAGLYDQVVAVLSGLGPLSLLRRGVRSDPDPLHPGEVGGPSSADRLVTDDVASNSGDAHGA